MELSAQNNQQKKASLLEERWPLLTKKDFFTSEFVHAPVSPVFYPPSLPPFSLCLLLGNGLHFVGKVVVHAAGFGRMHVWTAKLVGRDVLVERGLDDIRTLYI